METPTPPTPEFTLELYAWVAEDETGHVGPVTIAGPLGLVPAVSTNQEQLTTQAVLRYVDIVSQARQKPALLVKVALFEVLETRPVPPPSPDPLPE